MKKISTLELSNLIQSEGFSEYLFSTLNQSISSSPDNMHVNLRFNKMVSASAQGVVYLYGECGNIYFECVDYICIRDKKTVLGIVLDIICDYNGGKVKYTVVAS